ncbi:MAG: hypothetical protein N2Z72_08430 [Bacteroidales bacterium]|nr:hypothetical protein [Bacteroidales bacterium]
MKNYILFIMLIVLFSCKVKVKKIEQPTKDILRENTFTSSSSETLFKIDTVYEKNELLYVVFSYHAKEAAEFDLVWNSMWIKTYPPKTTFEPYMKNYTPGKKAFKHYCAFSLDNFNSSRPFYLNIKGYPHSIFLDKLD